MNDMEKDCFYRRGVYIDRTIPFQIAKINMMKQLKY